MSSKSLFFMTLCAVPRGILPPEGIGRFKWVVNGPILHLNTIYLKDFCSPATLY